MNKRHDIGRDFTGLLISVPNRQLLFNTAGDWPSVDFRKESWVLNEVFRFVLQPDGTYKIISKIISETNGKVLDVDGGHSEDGTKVCLWEDTGAENQKWCIEELDDKFDGYPIIVLSPFCAQNSALTLVRKTTDPNKTLVPSEVQIYTRNESCAEQRFWIYRVDPHTHCEWKKQTAEKKIFIIHGHNEAKWRELAGILKQGFGLDSIELDEQPNRGKTIIEKFEYYAKNCQYAIALFTPDDIVEKDGEHYFQARPNVIFELGWFYAKLGRENVCIINQESDKSVIFSDLQGIVRLSFNKNIKEVYLDIQKELRAVKLI